MTWVNKPNKAQEITSILITTTKRYNIDVTNYIEGRSGISICIYIAEENFIDDWLVIHSKDVSYHLFNPPELTWTYEALDIITITNPTSTTSVLAGEDLEIKGNYSGFIIIKHNNDFLGTGKYKEGRILNYVGKSRRVNLL